MKPKSSGYSSRARGASSPRMMPKRLVGSSEDAFEDSEADLYQKYIIPGFSKVLEHYRVKTYRELAGVLFKSTHEINVAENTESYWKDFFTSNTNDYEKIFPKYGSCSRSLQSYVKTIKASRADPVASKKIRSDLLKKREKIQDDLITAYAKNLRIFANMHFGVYCTSSPESSDPLSESDRKKCERIDEMKAELISLPGDETPGSYEQARAFVQKWILKPKENFGSFTPDPKKGQADLYRMNSRLLSTLEDLCLNVRIADRQTYISLEYDTYTTLFRSKPFMDSLFESFYTKEKLEAVQSNGKKVHNWIKNRLHSMKCAPQDQIDLALKDLESLTISAIEKPKDSDLTQHRFNIPVLKAAGWGEYPSATELAFGYGSSRFFTEDNAVYYPKGSRNPPMLFMMGNLFLNADKNKEGTQFVMAHEFGHHLDPIRAMQNGYPDIAKCYLSLFDCLKSKTKFGSEDPQMGETISDVYSAEYLADQLEKLPISDRRKAVGSYIEFFCKSAAAVHGGKSSAPLLSGGDVHPDVLIRLNQTVGGNKKLRKTLGCSLDSKTVPVCELGHEGEKK